MKIDAHQHFWFSARRKYSWLEGDALTAIRREFGPQDLKEELERSALDGSVLVQTCSSLLETLEFLDIAAQTPFVLGVVGWADLTDPELGPTLDALLQEVGGKYLVGLRHQVHDEADRMWLLRADVNRGLERVSARGLTYDLLVRSRELLAARQVARAHPELTFVIDHAAKPDVKGGNVKAGGLESWRASLEPFSLLPNVYIKLSGLVTEADWTTWTPEQIVPYFRACLELFGPERCLFGSDWPVCLLAARYGQTLELVMEALEGQVQTAVDAVLGGSAARAYRLQERGLVP